MLGSGPEAAEARTSLADRFLALADPRLDRVYRLAGLLLGNAADAEDAVQDALARAWQGFADLRDLSRFDAWLDRIVVNACRDRLRRRQVVRFVPLDGVTPMGADPFAATLAADELLGALEHLTLEERVVIVLHYWADLSLDDVATRLGIPVGTCKSRLNRALQRLRAELPR